MPVDSNSRKRSLSGSFVAATTAIMSYIPLLANQLPQSPRLVSETSPERQADNSVDSGLGSSFEDEIDFTLTSTVSSHTSSSRSSKVPSRLLTYSPPAKRAKLSSSPVNLVYTGTISNIVHLPSDLLNLVLSYSTTQAFYSTSLACKLFNEANASKAAMASLNMEFRTAEDGAERGILDSAECREKVLARVNRFALQGNIEAQYYLGVVKMYGFEVEEGVEILRKTSRKDHVKSMYALGIAVRDCRRSESNALLASAGSHNYYPALSEILDNSALKQRFKEPNAEQLKEYMMPGSLNRHLKRFFVEDERLKGHVTSHCWNPLCGKWAHKAKRDTGVGVEATATATIASAVGTATPTTATALTSTNHSAPSTPPSSSSSPPIELPELKVSRMKMCSSCRKAKYCSKTCQVYDWRSGRHKSECVFL
ncbi:hypothetical protein TrVE_jg6727 [Triparma verrucosa]|uniref:MYND-type domain-containing protein n=1 Tax=Triparma verrucosa TaxID=1606542 RepID=A0A9W7BKP6_9STRA|nr:hypothetical protein TrVE_jg6727 [Triparma verrucosa]